MRVLILYPPISKQERYSSQIGNAGGNQIPLGIYYLASFLRQNGHDVQVIDGEAQTLDAHACVERILAFKPCIVGISSTTVAFHRAVEIAEILREQQPDIPLVLGGPHVTTNPSGVLASSIFEYGVVGEGEVSFLELIQALNAQTDLGSVQGIVHKKEGEVCQTPTRPFIAPLDSLPFPAYDLIPDLSAYNPPPCNYRKIPVANIITSRGCPNRCTFCDQSIFGRQLRQRSAENIVSEIELLHTRYGIREIAFVDDTFTIDNERIRQIFSLLNQKGISFPWTCMSRINTVDEDILRFMKDAGCWHISFGIESGNREILKRIQKNIELERVVHVVRLCSNIGLKTKGFFIIGHPGETQETIEETIRFALSIPLDDIVVTINTPIPGSVQYTEASQYGSLDETDWRQFNYHRPVFVPNGLSQQLLTESYRNFYRRFYFRPRILWRYWKSFWLPGGIKRFVQLFRALPFLFKKS